MSEDSRIPIRLLFARARTLIVGAIAVAVAATAITAAAAADRAKKGPPPPPPASFSITPASLNFGAIEYGSASTPQPMTITNTGSTSQAIYTLVGESPTDPLGDSGDFNQASQGCTDGRSFPVTLAPGDSCTVTIVFTPEDDGPRSAILQVLKAPQEVDASAQLSGTGFSSGLYVGSMTPFPATLTGGASMTATVRMATTPGGSDCVPVSLPVTVEFAAQAWALENGRYVNVLTVPSVVVPAGQCEATFTVNTASVPTVTTGGILAYTADDPNGYPNDSVGVEVTINP